MVDRENAAIRRDTKRASPDAKAAEAERLLSDPAFTDAAAAVREGLLAELEGLKHDGQPETDAYERELCRALRTLESVKRALSMRVQGQKLRLADFKPQAPTSEDN